ncbi:UDP-N-acetylmuramoyl-L-alanyl-D-glutamate--2,6-diaminopimelate ligase [Candidatus Daviesbacteria bacterium]|nr:UDP-N-acetylmuramoyl-L-alanyl-D-glutamate--2,6-diaminopimelate ligase [Candidatus Daviesbacteria bacterium]
MKRLIRKLVPNRLVNLGKHLPEGVMANIQYGFPGKKLRVIGVTGTDGKTTTVNLIYQMLKDVGKKVSMISTINSPGLHVTSPNPFLLQKLLKKSLENGDEFMVLEVTSHALEQFRVWGIKFEIGVVTNITHEHLDYHGTFEKYFQAKAKLIKNVKWAILNKDDANFDKLVNLTTGKIISFGLKKSADVSPFNFPLKLKIPGEYNVYNAEASAAVGMVLGLDQLKIKKSLEHFAGLVGRMEKIKNNLGVKIVVDFAHTPNALEQALKTLRSQTWSGKVGKIISVFGCAGARDVEKRPMMGKISAKLADITILTDEDPRYEDRNKIIDVIAKAATSAGAVEGETLFREPDRGKAIKLAIKMAQKGDTVGIFGKGHEKSMNYQGKEKLWSDQRAVTWALKHG